MNRLAVYSYLTRYTYGHTWYWILFTGPVPEKSYPVSMVRTFTLKESVETLGLRLDLGPKHKNRRYGPQPTINSFSRITNGFRTIGW